MATGNLQPQAIHSGPLQPLRDWIGEVGAAVVGRASAVGNFALFSVRTISWLIIHPPNRETLLPTFYQVGVRSLPVVALTGTFIGMVLAVQTLPHD